jgi:hypothetical protein
MDRRRRWFLIHVARSTNWAAFRDPRGDTAPALPVLLPANRPAGISDLPHRSPPIGYINTDTTQASNGIPPPSAGTRGMRDRSSYGRERGIFIEEERRKTTSVGLFRLRYGERGLGLAIDSLASGVSARSDCRAIYSRAIFICICRTATRRVLSRRMSQRLSDPIERPSAQRAASLPPPRNNNRNNRLRARYVRVSN